jgi:NitT/TauT family transport system permease protein
MSALSTTEEVATAPGVDAAPSPRDSAAANAWQRPASQAGSIVACLLLWHWAATLHLNLGVITFANVPPPAEVLSAAWSLFQSPKLWPHLSSSLWRVGAGFGLAALLGIGLGLLIGRLRWARDALLPPLEVLRPIWRCCVRSRRWHGSRSRS